MEEQRKYAILFAATILAARKLNEGGSTPWAIHVAKSKQQVYQGFKR